MPALEGTTLWAGVNILGQLFGVSQADHFASRWRLGVAETEHRRSTSSVLPVRAGGPKVEVGSRDESGGVVAGDCSPGGEDWRKPSISMIRTLSTFGGFSWTARIEGDFYVTTVA